MRKIIGIVLLILMVVGLWTFTKSWRNVSPLGVGTGHIAGDSSDVASRDDRGLGEKTRASFSEILDNPTRYKDQRVTVTGRVRSPGKLASNRNIYNVRQGDDSILVIDDKKAPEPYETRTVNGVVKVVGPPIGGMQRAYVVDVKQGVKYNTPTWAELKNYFTGPAN